MNFSDVLFVPLGRRIADFWVTSPTTGFAIDSGNRDVVELLDGPCMGSRIENLLDIKINVEFARNFAACRYAYPVVNLTDAKGLDRLVPFEVEPHLFTDANLDPDGDGRYVHVKHRGARARIHALAWDALSNAHGHPDGLGRARATLRAAGGEAWNEDRFTGLLWGAVMATSSVGMCVFHRLDTPPSPR